MPLHSKFIEYFFTISLSLFLFLFESTCGFLSDYFFLPVITISFVHCLCVYHPSYTHTHTQSFADDDDKRLKNCALSLYLTLFSVVIVIDSFLLNDKLSSRKRENSIWIINLWNTHAHRNHRLVRLVIVIVRRRRHSYTFPFPLINKFSVCMEFAFNRSHDWFQRRTKKTFLIWPGLSQFEYSYVLRVWGQNAVVEATET